jgi:hypothetical protein
MGGYFIFPEDLRFPIGWKFFSEKSLKLNTRIKVKVEVKIITP